jgi:hypothetical protein
MASIAVIGDLHGYYDQYVKLLLDEGFINRDQDWIGADRHLWLIGDIFDRGPAGIECLSLTIKLQTQARSVGGEVQSLLGNHEMMLLCAYRMRQISSSISDTITTQWLGWGGIQRDLDLLTDKQADWLTALPAMTRLGDKLLIHADALIYITLGLNITDVNDAFKKVMQSTDINDWITVLGGFSDHKAFSDLSMTGTNRAQSMLRHFGGRQIIHGHTPISIARNTPADTVTGPWCYASELCVNVDGGIYLGGPGFVYKFEIPEI